MQIQLRISIAALISTPLFSEGYNDQLNKMISGPLLISATKAKELSRDKIDNINGIICGVRFGMSMQEVIDVWGLPNGITAYREPDSSDVDLIIYSSGFTFRSGQLTDIHIHSTDLPLLVLFDGTVKFGFPLPDLKILFNNATVSDAGPGTGLSVCEVTTAEKAKITFMLYDGNLVSVVIANNQ